MTKAIIIKNNDNCNKNNFKINSVKIIITHSCTRRVI